MNLKYELNLCKVLEFRRTQVYNLDKKYIKGEVMTVKELRVKLKDLGIQTQSNMRKAELEELYRRSVNGEKFKLESGENKAKHRGQKVLYIRVSTLDQNTARQEQDTSHYDKVFLEKASGKDVNRPQLQAMIDYVREGDMIEVHSFDRLARNTQNLLELTEEFEKKGVKLISKKEGIDTGTPTGKLMLTMIGAIAEFERSNLLERQREGIAIAKAKGKYKGRKAYEIPSNFKELHRAWRMKERTSKEIMEELGIKKTTFFKMVKEFEGRGNSIE